MFGSFVRAFAALVLGLLLSSGAIAAQMDDVRITAEPVAAGVYMLQGQGGNIGLLVGSDGAFLIDDQYAPLTDKILTAVRGITAEDVRFVINTHWHGDHTGGNENLGNAGVVLISHDNVRKRMASDQVMEFLGGIDTIPAAPQAALPVITFDDDVRFHLNGDQLHAFHTPHAHTDGDALIYFENANVIHMGDVYFNGAFPFIDLSSGGSVDGMIAAHNRALGIADSQTRIIPGHGPLSDAEELRAHRDMLRTIRNRIAEAIGEGNDLEGVLAMDPTEEWNASHGGGFISAEALVGAIYSSLGGG